jgi:hypothetical protein
VVEGNQDLSLYDPPCTPETGILGSESEDNAASVRICYTHKGLDNFPTSHVQ